MFSPRFAIMAQTTTGETIECFRWTRDAESGLRRARAEAPRFGYELARFWAEPLAADQERNAQLIGLRLAAPLRPIAGKTEPLDGLALFDADRSPSLF